MRRAGQNVETLRSAAQRGGVFARWPSGETEQVSDQLPRRKGADGLWDKESRVLWGAHGVGDVIRGGQDSSAQAQLSQGTT